MNCTLETSMVLQTNVIPKWKERIIKSENQHRKFSIQLKGVSEREQRKFESKNQMLEENLQELIDMKS